MVSSNMITIKDLNQSKVQVLSILALKIPKKMIRHWEKIISKKLKMKKMIPIAKLQAIPPTTIIGKILKKQVQSSIVSMPSRTMSIAIR